MSGSLEEVGFLDVYICMKRTRTCYVPEFAVFQERTTHQACKDFAMTILKNLPLCAQSEVKRGHYTPGAQLNLCKIPGLPHVSFQEYSLPALPDVVRVLN